MGSTVNLIKNVTGFVLASLIPETFLFAKCKPEISKHFVGLGNAGCNVLSMLKAQGIEGKFTFISNSNTTYISDSNGKSISRPCSQKQKNWSLAHELDPTPITTDLKKLFTAQTKYVLVAGLGNYTGTNLTYKLYNYLTEQNISFDVYCCTPFAFEGKKRKEFANQIVKEIGSKPNFYHYCNELLRSKYGNLKVKDAFTKSDKALCLIINSK